MHEQTLRDASRNVIGFLVTSGDGTQTAYDETRQFLGRYDPATDMTYDSSGFQVGEGNLAGLLFRA